MIRDYEMIRCMLVVQLLTALSACGLSSTARAYPIVAKECKADPVKCAIDGRLAGIEIYGNIGHTDYDLVEAIHRALPSSSHFPKIYLDSPGGQLYYAVEIGKILRDRKAEVFGGSPYMHDAYVECSSACVFIAAGATSRQLNHIGLHNGSSFNYGGPKKWSETELSSDDMSYFLTYLDEMGIDPEVKKIILETPSNKISNFYFKSSEKFGSQKIVKFGFHMLEKSDLPEIKLPGSDETARDASEQRYINAIQYGNNAAIHDYVREILQTKFNEEPNYEEANKWLQIGADRDDPTSLHNLAVHLSHGKGLKADTKLAAEYYLRAARLGSAASQNNVGWHYYTGDGVKRSIPDAVFWITRAADQGEPFAYGSLCEMYDAGDVFEPNDIEAYKWCRLAVDLEPDGRVKDVDSRILEKFKNKLSYSDKKKAEELAKAWKPIIDVGGHMRDPDDG